MHKNLRIFNVPNGIEFQSTSLRPSGTNRRVLLHLLLHITLRIITLLLTNYWGKPIRVPEHTKSIEYLHLNIQKGRGAKMHGKHMKTSKYWHSPSCHQCLSQDCMNRQLHVSPPTAPTLPLTALTIHILSYVIFVGNTYYAIATFSTPKKLTAHSTVVH